MKTILIVTHFDFQKRTSEDINSYIYFWIQKAEKQKFSNFSTKVKLLTLTTDIGQLWCLSIGLNLRIHLILKTTLSKFKKNEWINQLMHSLLLAVDNSLVLFKAP